MHPDRVYDFRVKGPTGAACDLAAYQGQVLLLVNVASRCGFTPQYAALEALYRRYQGQGFTVLGFPCNQFGGQEPAGDAEIQTFCRSQYDVTFPVFGKIDVKGPGADPLYQWLCARAPGLWGTRAIKWNFTKFLIDRSGHVRARHAPRTPPARLALAIEHLLADPSDP